MAPLTASGANMRLPRLEKFREERKSSSSRRSVGMAIPRGEKSPAEEAVLVVLVALAAAAAATPTESGSGSGEDDGGMASDDREELRAGEMGG